MNPDDVSLNVNRVIGNQDFFLNIVDYMMDNSFMLEIRSKQIDVRELDKTKVTKHANYYKLINLVLPIAIILIYLNLLQEMFMLKLFRMLKWL